MAVAFDAVGPSSAGAGGTSISSLSWTHTNVAGNAALTVGCSYDNSTDAGVTATCKVDSVLITAATGNVESDAQTAGFAKAWTALGLASGARTVLVTYSSAGADLEGGSVSYTGAGGFAAAATASGTLSTSASVTVTGTAASSLVFGFAAAGDSINATSAPATSRFVNNLVGSAGNSTGNCAGSTSAGGGAAAGTWARAEWSPRPPARRRRAGPAAAEPAGDGTAAATSAPAAPAGIRRPLRLSPRSRWPRSWCCWPASTRR